MSEYYRHLLVLLQGIWRRRWYGILVAWLVCVAGWIWVARVPDQYESSTRIHVDTDTMLAPLMQGLAVDTNVFRGVNIMQRTLLSRPNLEQVARMTDLDLTVDDRGGMERLIKSLRKNIKIVSQGPSLFTVSFTSDDPELAKSVVQSVLTIFVEGNLGASRKDMDQARRFIEEQIKVYERKLNEAEQRRTEFRKKNLTVLSGGEGFYETMEKVKNTLKQTRALLDQEISKRDALRKQLEAVPEFFETETNSGLGPPTNLDLRILELQQQIDALKLRYTDNHPDVVALRRTLDKLQQQLDERDKKIADTHAAALSEDGGSSSNNTAQVANPVYQQIKLALVTEEANIAILRKRVAQQENAVKEQEAKANAALNAEAEFTNLDRDYSIIKSNYQQLLARRESAKLAQDLETKTDQVQFRIIDPPKVPVEPSGPNRLLFLTVVMIGGLAAGIAFSFVLSQVDDSFPTATSLMEAFVVPVIGTVSAVISTADRRIRVLEISSFALVCLGLAGAFAGVLAIEVFDVISLG
ncbi:MAG: XrtA system polysaccharide chain length determinant [Alphaproteobacteria bacterium]